MSARIPLCLVVAFVLASAMMTMLTESDTDAAVGDVFESGGIQYTIVDGSEYQIDNAVEVTHSSGNSVNNSSDSTYSGDISIPATVSNQETSYSVIGIGDQAFIGANISSINLPEGLRYINRFAFGNSELTSIKIPSTVVYLGSGTSNSSLFSNSGGGANKIETVTFAEGSQLREIRSNVFEGCVNLKQIEIPSTVTVIGKSVFSGCDSLETVTMPQGVTDLNTGSQYPFIPNTTNTFSGWNNAPSVKFAEGSQFEIEDGLIYKGTELVLALEGNGDSAIIRDGTTSIGDNAFCATDWDSVVIPSTVASIGNCSFYNLKAESIVFVGMTSPTLGTNALSNSSTSISVPKGSTGYDGLGVTLSEYGITLPSEEIVLVLDTEKTIIVQAEYTSPIVLSAVSDSSSISVEASSDGNIMLLAEDNVSATVVVSLQIGGVVLDEAELTIKVLKSQESDDDGNIVSVEESEEVDGNTQQTITTTITTVTDSVTGDVISSTTSISTSTTNIETVATVSDGVATVVVTADSTTPLDNILGQANLISDVVKDDDSLPDNISKTEIEITNEDVGASVTLTLDVIKSLNNEVTEDYDIRIVVDKMDTDVISSAQSVALGDGTAFELTAAIVDTDGRTVGTVHELEDHVEAFLPYSDVMGDPWDLGVYYIDNDGRITDMGSTYDENRGGFVFRTNHFSLFAVMEISDVEPDDQYDPPIYPDDDDSYIPPAIVVEEDSGETTKVVACAAAAVVAALMAAFLIIDGRRK